MFIAIDRARDFNIILDDVALTELSFGKDYSAAVESKQVAQQEAQRAVFVVERALQEKQQKIVQAEGMKVHTRKRFILMQKFDVNSRVSNTI